MTLLRFNHPAIINRLAQQALYANKFDSNHESSFDYHCNNNANYRVDEEETAINIEFAVPGLTKADLIVEIENETLTVKTKQRDENDQRVGFAALEFEKKFKISEKINKELISAHTEAGLLKITLPKIDEAIKKPARTIEVL